MFAWYGEVNGDDGLGMYLVHFFIGKLWKRLERLADNVASKCCTRQVFTWWGQSARFLPPDLVESSSEEW